MVTFSFDDKNLDSVPFILALQDKRREPMPPEVFKAIITLTKFIHERRYTQVIVGNTGGALFRDSDIMRELLHWQNEADRKFEDAVGWEK